VPQDAATGRVQLKPAQQRVLDALPAGADLTRAQYEELAGVSRSQAAYDLAELVEAGILHRVGAGRATRYRLAREGGGQRHWTSDRIRAELEAFCAASARQTWPSAAEFKAAGRGDLYVAASRYGGIAHWAEALGYRRPSRVATAMPGPPAPRRKLTWAAAGALAAIGLATAAGGMVFSLTRDAAPVAPVASPPTAPAGATGGAPQRHASHALRPPQTRRAAVQKARRHRQKMTPARHARLASVSPVSHASPSHSSSLTGPSSSTASTATRQYTSAVTASSGPAPLRAPSTSSAPAPIKAP
jgi:hypothetical protein